MHTDCDVLHRVCLMSYRELVWYNWCTGLDDTDRVDVVSDIEGVMSRNNACDVIQNVVWSHKIWMWCLIEVIWYCTYSECYVIPRKCVISSNEWGLWHRDSGCHVVYNGYDVVNYSGSDLRKTVGVISSIQWMWWHRYSGHDVKYSGCDDINTVVWGHKVRMWCLVYGKQCHTYGECDVIQRVGVMLSILWVWGHR